jgi:hypothetical protein
MKRWLSVKVLSMVFLVVFSLGFGVSAFGQPSMKVEITTPERDNLNVEKEMDVKGTATFPSGNYLWVLVHRVKGFKGLWWPQGEADVHPVTKEWESHVVFGGPQDIGFEFEIAAIVVNGTEHSKLSAYWTKAMSSGSWPPIPMPPTVSAPVIRNVKKTGH